MKKLLSKYLKKTSRWIVDEEGCLGIRVLGVNMFYYKWPEPLICKGNYRVINKREFGEVIQTNN